MQPLSEEYHALAVEILRDLVRIDTSNPPGNELAAAHYLYQRLHPYGLSLNLFESAPQRGNLIARLPGSGQALPLLIIGHLDVMPVHGQEWLYPPFGAEIHNGQIWGRGTTDMKQMVAISAAILIAMVRSGLQLKRDLVIAATADEEQGSTFGMQWLIRNAPGLLAAECALNEGGGNCMRIGEQVFYTFQVAEKGVCRTEWAAQGRDGHASQPGTDIAAMRLVQALVKLGDGHIRSGVTYTMRQAVELIARRQGSEASELATRMLAQQRVEPALTAAGLATQTIRSIRPLFYDTAAISMLRAGSLQALNMLPAQARAWVDGRILPGQTRGGYLSALQAYCSEGVTIQPLQGQHSPGLELPIPTQLMSAAAEALARQAPGATLIPWMCSGATDASTLAALKIPTYGFVPALPEAEHYPGGPHGANEHISLQNVRFALDTLYDLVGNYCGAC